MEPSERLMPALRRYVKYNNSDELINGFDYKLTIDIVYEMQAEIDELKVLLEAKDHVIDCAIDLVEKTVLEGFYATSDVYVDFRDALKPFMV